MQHDELDAKKDFETGVSKLEPIEDIQLKDKVIRILGIPVLGIAIPTLTGLFDHLNKPDVKYWAGYPYFILLVTLVWHGNRYLLYRTRHRFTWFEKPTEKVLLLFFNSIIFTIPLTTAWLCLWYRLTGFPSINWNTILIVVLVIVVSVLFITHVYETVFLVKEKQQQQAVNARLSQAKAEAELQALKNQIDPHFMFNTLNSLSYLITKNSNDALRFTENLADMYRYILSQKEHMLVLLEDELLFVEKYIALLIHGFGDALVIKKYFIDRITTSFLIPPISVFIAFENIVKHNKISEQEPMEVILMFEDNHLVVQNELREKKNSPNSSKIGLQNLNERFKILTGEGISTTKTETHFSITFPLVKLS
jgi:sensor histidine kinase YesM